MMGLPTRTESHGYDPQLDYLTSANYGDGNPNATPTWTYDAAGNRGDAVVDNLNRATSIGGVAMSNEILGNRTATDVGPNQSLLGWDCLNRLTSWTGPQQGQYWTYDYRADGMRVDKTTGANTVSSVTTRCRYDGQMGIEDVETGSSGTTVMRYGLGARGVDLIERTDPQGNVTTGFPIYDAHGNDVATLTRSGSGYGIGDRRTYDAWGVVRSQQSSGDPKLRYCANLGHKADDESGLIYMRARYYEPSSGRFVSEDPESQGRNWLTYCGNDPVGNYDPTGRWMVNGGNSSQNLWIRGWFSGIYLCALGAAATPKTPAKIALLTLAAGCAAMALGAANMTFVESAIVASPGFTAAVAAVAVNLDLCGSLPVGKLLGPLVAAQEMTLVAACAYAMYETEETDPGGP